MTLILKIDLDVVKMYLHTKNKIFMWSISKVIAWTDRHTYTQEDMSENITYPHTQVVIIKEIFTRESKISCDSHYKLCS